MDPVIVKRVADVLYERDKQRIDLYGCVIEIVVPEYYGEIKIYDDANRLLGTTTKGRISFTKEKLQTRESQVWYDAAANFSSEYKQLNKLVSDPGLDFSCISKIFIEFLEAPSVTENPNRKYNYVHIFYDTFNIWDKNNKLLMFSRE